MADANKLRRLGAPPALEEARADLALPEPKPERPAEPLSIPMRKAPPPIPADYVPLDARSLRRSGRTVQLSTRVSHDFDQRLRRIAAERNLMIVEVLEIALRFLEESIRKEGGNNP